MKNSVQTSRISVRGITKTAVVAALYLVITLFLSTLSFGVVQIRIAEMFNYLVLFNKRYLWGVTLGVFLSNFASPTWTLDVPIGTASTFIVLIIVMLLTKPIKSMLVKFVLTAIVVSLSMFTIAWELNIMTKAPFLAGWLTIGLGELLSMTVGGIIIYLISKRIDLKK
ncbi:QueT transporter family protein [Paucilactobacillus suebicus]|uniref:QueT transporter family protein n=1 Tax=Paucilactobacillus suebicus DSM 5007 = KCTC 3549 TaxID=1423807 RepID=A0A0R1WH06_9LACO|nr:QueT transporter family protein [Paucilactobacillus suebicus]KRM13324.1 hypothetical protein FD16_GL000799 [Paucilactobacillus suebicus DSM 5007 = KCTC 3549]